MKDLSNEIESCCPWVHEVSDLNKRTWEILREFIQKDKHSVVSHVFLAPNLQVCVYNLE